MARLYLCAIALLLFACVPALAQNKIANPGFESGAFAPWTVTDQAAGSGSFFVNSGTTTSFSSHTTVGPASGTFYAVSDQGGPGTHALRQTFTIPTGAVRVILAFKMFVNAYAPVAINAAGLDYTAIPNEHARVDILTASATAFDTGAGVLRNLYLGVDAAANPHAYTSYSFDITPTVGGAGGTFQLRFAEVDNQSFLNMGVDDVSITFGTCAHHSVHAHIDTIAPNHTGNQDVHHGQHGHTVDPSQADCGHAPAGHHLLTGDAGEGLFSADAQGEPPTFVAGLNEDGSFNGAPGTAAAPAVQTLPAKRGSVLQLFGSAAGFYMDAEHVRLVGDFAPPASGAPLYYTTIVPEVRVGGVPAKVLFSGLAPALKGVWQINLLVPEELSPGDAPVEITFDGAKLTSVSVAIE